MLNDRELATVLAALRYWQRDLSANGGHDVRGPLAQHFIDHPPLTLEQIDRLCDRLNQQACGSVHSAPVPCEPSQDGSVPDETHVFVLYDYDLDVLATTRVFNHYDEAADVANSLNNVLVAPLVFNDVPAGS